MSEDHHQVLLEAVLDGDIPRAVALAEHAGPEADDDQELDDIAFRVVLRVVTSGSTLEVALGCYFTHGVLEEDLPRFGCSAAEQLLWTHLVHGNAGATLDVLASTALAVLLIGTGRGTLGLVVLDTALDAARRDADPRAVDQLLSVACTTLSPDGAYPGLKPVAPGLAGATADELDHARTRFRLARELAAPAPPPWWEAQPLLSAATTWFWMTGEVVVEGYAAAGEALGTFPDRGLIVQSERHGTLFRTLAATATERVAS